MSTSTPPPDSNLSGGAPPATQEEGQHKQEECGYPVSHGTPTWFEVPATNVNRAKQFFSRVFAWSFKSDVPGYEDEEKMVLFDMTDGRMARLGVAGGIVRVNSDDDDGSAATVLGGKNAVLVYLMVDDLDDTLGKVEREGGKIVLGRKPEGNHGFLAKIVDTEGNWWGVYQARK